MKNYILIILLFFTQALNAQYYISGHITDSLTMEPVENVNILIKGTKIGAASDSIGYFEIKARGFPMDLCFSHLNYQNKTITIEKNQDELNVLLNPDIYELGTATVKPVVNIS